MKDWHKFRSKLFKDEPDNLTGCDAYHGSEFEKSQDGGLKIGMTNQLTELARSIGKASKRRLQIKSLIRAVVKRHRDLKLRGRDQSTQMNKRHGFIEGVLCLPKTMGGGGLVHGWALHDVADTIYLEVSGKITTSVTEAFRYPRDDVALAFPGSAFNSSGAGFLAFVPGLLIEDKIELSFGVPGQKEVLSTCSNAEELPSRPIDLARKIFQAFSTPLDRFAERSLLVDWPLISRAQPFSVPKLPSNRAPISIGTIVERPLVSVIIPIYGRFDFIESQIMEFSRDSFIRKNCEIIYVIDDPKASDGVNGLAFETCKLFDFSVSLLGDDLNRGFAGASNFGASVARGEYLLFMNSDVIPSCPGWLSDLVDRIAISEDVGAVGPRLLFADGGIQHGGMEFKFNSELKIWTNTHPGKGLSPELDDGPPWIEVPAVTGACLLIRRTHFDDVGGWDEGYLIGDFEDSHLCLALQEKGLRILYDRTVDLIHLERQSMVGLGDPDFRQRVVIANAARHQELWRHRLDAMEFAK